MSLISLCNKETSWYIVVLDMESARRFLEENE